MKPRWTPARIELLLERLADYRASRPATTLGSVGHANSSPFRLLVSCIISLRTKDAITRDASRRLFDLAPTPDDLASLDEEQIAEAIYPAGFYNTKARQLREIGRLLRDLHRGLVPKNENELLALPGVGRKTATLVLGLGFGVPAICVDTHVHRISNRLGLVDTDTPAATELALRAVLPTDAWIPVNDLLVTFGQGRCRPTSPRCTGCPVDSLCPRIGVGHHR